jgi:hypothetical protein
MRPLSACRSVGTALLLVVGVASSAGSVPNPPPKDQLIQVLVPPDGTLSPLAKWNDSESQTGAMRARFGFREKPGGPTLLRDARGSLELTGSEARIYDATVD